MTTNDTDWNEKLGLNRLPRHIVNMRVADLLDLSGKKAIVTGAGSDGLGYAVANRLAGAGADVALVGRTFAKVESRAKEIKKRWGVKTVPILADVSDWEQIHRAVTESKEALGGIDILVNNAMTMIPGPFATLTKDQIDLSVLQSFTMVMYGAHAALEHMLPQRSGTIINIATAGARMPFRKLVVYCAAKTGVVGFTRNLAHEVESSGVRVLGVAPGVMLNADLEKYVLHPQNEWEMVAREAVGEGLDYAHIKRAGLPEEVANMVIYLASPAASYMCGQTIDVSGGQYMD